MNEEFESLKQDFFMANSERESDLQNIKDDE
jgi:hypothetical protein